MSMSVSDSPDADIRMAYQNVAHSGSLNWLLLSYGKWAGGLKLFAAGSRGISELRQNVTEDNVYFAFFRESVDNVRYYATVAYIPEAVSGLRRTRALATARTVQGWFKVSQAMLSITHRDGLTTDNIVKYIRSHQLPDVPAFSPPVSRQGSYDPQKSLPRVPPTQDRMRSPSMSSDPPSRSGSPAPTRGWGMLDPEERARRRQEAQLRKKAEDEAAAKQELLRQQRRKREKEDMLRQLEDEEMRRKAMLESDLRRAAMIKAEKEEEERLAEVNRVMERELKKRQDAERRSAETHRIEAWRMEEQRKIDELSRQVENAKIKVEEVKQMSAATASKLREHRLREWNGVLLRGWVTIQNANSLVWRRRYFELTETSMKLYKNDKELGKVLDTVELTGRLRGVKEWNDGFEELRAIEHSFALDFGDLQEPVSAYTDSAREKADMAGFLLTYV
ncbi:hypothetical protein PENSPDRAFT_659868 [Peniophora sp. CONT]|nr:hypothetical protein PENSPDRAFT_659868 [Peniophora sp. CONT]